MDWNLIFNQVLTQIGTAAVIATALGVVGKIAVDHVFTAGLETLKAELRAKHDKELLAVKHDFESDLQLEKAKADKSIILFQHGLETKAAGDERVRRELVAWANPILDAVNSLCARLGNILDNKGYEGLDPHTATATPNWSMDYDYFLTSTLFLFSQYFCWIRMLEEALSFEIFRSHHDMDEFFSKVNAVSRALGDYPPNYPGTGNDTQVFRLQQRAIGEAVAVRQGRRRACLGYNLFAARRSASADTELRPFLIPLEKLIDVLKPGERRFARIEAVRAALTELQSHCKQLLGLP